MNKKILSVFAALCVLLAAAGCGNSAPAATTPAETTTTTTTTTTAATTTAAEVEENVEEEESEESDEGYEEDSEEEDNSGDEGGEEDSEESGNSGSDADAISSAWGELYGYPYSFTGGTAKTLDGNIAVVSVFVNTEEFPWDFNELMETEAYQYYLNDLYIATNYLTEKAQAYGKSPNFIWDWSEHDKLCSLSSTDLIEPIKGSRNFGMAWQHISTEIDTAAILEETGAEQIIYIFVYNTPPEYEVTGENQGPYCQTYGNDEAQSADNIDPDNPPDPPYETIFLTMGYYDGQPQYVTPSCVAHEILHAFGAEDLYSKDAGSYMYNISQEFIDYINNTDPLDDIMRNPETGEAGNYESINSEISEVTAYYVGLTDSSEIVEQWGFEPRQNS